ncbi:hypothetical protein K439DRAFT_300469 [Ramaria rubella]|nr:hypothetical protein K439DRAFT_300469 [Ramaria rubella]
MYEHRITQVVEELAKERDLAMVASQNAQEASIIRDELQNAKNRLTEENARLSDDVQVLQKDISRLTTDCEDKCEQIKNLTKERETESEKMRAAFQHVHDLETAQIRLEVENARLQKENTHLSAESTANTRRLSELDDDELAKYLSEEIKVRKLRLGKPAKINEPGRKTIDITGDSSSTGNCRRWTSKRNAKNEDEGDDTEGEHELEDDFDSKAEEAHASERGISFGIPWLPSCNIPVSRADSPSPRSEPGSLPLRDEVLIFNRHFLQAQLGGGLISLQVRIGVGNLKRKAIGRELEINSFMCPNLDHNPWAPTYPGQDEYMFVGLGKEEGAFLISETHEVFVQFAPKKMFYAGKYECVKTRDSTPTEWHGLDEKLKRRYCKTTISKTKQGGTVETVLRAYDEGELRAPCAGTRTEPGSSGSNSIQRRKRKRIDDSDESDPEPNTPHRRRNASNIPTTPIDSP